MILEVSSPIIADELAWFALGIQYYECRYPIDPVTLFQRLNALLIGVWHCKERHRLVVPLEGCLVPIVRAEDDLHHLFGLIHFLIELYQTGCEQTTRGSPMRPKVYSNELYFLGDVLNRNGVCTPSEALSNNYVYHLFSSLVFLYYNYK